MKHLFITFCSLFLFSVLSAQELATIKLVEPDKKRGKTVMQALNERQSTREYSTQMLKDQDLSDVLWAANGINRSDGKRTAPSALNKQDVDIYVVTGEGAYLYDHKAHVLTPVAKGDFRSSVAGSQAYVKDAPVSLVLVSELSRFGDKVSDHTKLMAAVDIGVVSQNISIFCAATGLATVPRGFMDADALRKILKLSDTQLILLNHPVGYKK